MPAHRGVEVWIEDSQHQKLNHREVTINLVDDRTVTVKCEMPRDELYTVHCLSPISVFCDVFFITASGSRSRATRFSLDKRLSTSQNASGSSVDCILEEQFRARGLRTPKRQRHGKLGSVEVEIRRIDEIIKGELEEENEPDEDEYAATEITMIDDFGQPPWLRFHFEISTKESEPCRGYKSGSQPGFSGTRSNFETRDTGDKCLYDPRKRPRYDDHGGPTGLGEEPACSNLDQLQGALQKEEAEERRLLHKFQERLRAKKMRNMELRILLGETP